MTEQPLGNVPSISNRSIAINLDTVERDNVRPPFVFVLNGHEFQLEDAANFDWQFVNGIEDEVELLKEAMTPEDLEIFLAAKLPLWKMEKLGSAYQEHFGAGEPEKAERSGS